MQFNDDMVLLCDGSSSNLWALKSILRGFEMVFGLKINSWKIYLCGVGIEESLFSAATIF